MISYHLKCTDTYLVGKLVYLFHSMKSAVYLRNSQRRLTIFRKVKEECCFSFIEKKIPVKIYCC